MCPPKPLVNVLLIDETSARVEAVTRVLLDAGHRVALQRVDSAAAVRRALADGAVDAVVGRLGTPDLGASSTLELLRETGRDIPFIVLCGETDEAAAIATVRQGARDYVLDGHLPRLAPALERELRDVQARKERRQAEEALRHETLGRRLLMDASLDGICVINQRHEVVEANQRFADMLGYSPEEVLRLHTWDWEATMSEAQIRERFADLTTTAAVFETRHRRKDGTTYEAEVSAAGTLVVGEPMVFTISRDITSRKRAEMALRTSESFLDSIIEQSPHPMWISDHRGVLLRLNQACRDLLHLTDDEVVGKYCILEDSIVVSQGFVPLIRGVFERGETARFEIDYDTSQLRSLPLARRTHVVLAVTAFPIRDADDRITHAVIQHLDVTEHRRSEEALAESERRFRGIFEGVADGILVSALDDGRVVMANQAMGALLGYAPEELSHLGLDDLLPGAADLGQKDTSLARGVSLRRKDGGVLSADVRTVRLEFGGRPCRLSVFRDMTELNAMEAQMRQAQKIEAVGQLAGGIAHDFNNILGVIMGHCELALAGATATGPLPESLEQIRAGTQRAAALTRQLLAFSRKQTLAPRVVDLNSIVRGLHSMIERLIGEDIELLTVLAPDLGRVKVDPGQIEQVIVNLVVNARDAMPHGGRLTVSTANMETDAGYAKERAWVAPGAYVLVTVTDTGVGMTPETRERLFEPFFTTKEKGKGTGLGLSTAYGIVKQSGGYIWASGQPGAGSSFEVCLPRTAEPLAEEGAPTPRARYHGEGERVLIVEDEPALRAVVKEALTRLGYRAAVAANGAEALRVVEAGEMVPDLVVTDVVMPGMSGPVLVEHLRRRLPQLKVLLMSGYPGEHPERDGITGLGTPFIQKPFKVHDLAARVWHVLQERDDRR